MTAQSRPIPIIEERAALGDKIKSLNSFLEATADFSTTESLEILRIQLAAMNLYASTLDALIRLSAKREDK